MTARPAWARAAWWRAPVAPLYLSTLVMSFGKGAWFTCWALFFIRSVGLSPGQFAIGITAAGVVGLLAGGPCGYLADRVGARETLVVLGVLQGTAILSYAVVREFWAVVAVTCVMMAAERAAPGIRIAVVSGLTTDAERIDSISTTRVMSQVGIVVGAVPGALVLSLDSPAGYLGLVLSYGGVSLLCAAMLLRVPHVTSLRDRQVRRKGTVLRDRPFLVITAFNGLLALNWGMVDSGIPLWILHHTEAPTWAMGVLVAFNAATIVLFQNRVSRRGRTTLGAARLGLWSGVVLAASCAVFAASYHLSGAVVLLVLAAGALTHVVGELFFAGSGLGLSVNLTPGEAHGEYQGVFNTGQAAAMMLAPGLMTVLLVEVGVLGWFVLAGTYLVGGVGTIAVHRWAVRTRPRVAARARVRATPAS